MQFTVTSTTIMGAALLATLLVPFELVAHAEGFDSTNTTSKQYDYLDSFEPYELDWTYEWSIGRQSDSQPTSPTIEIHQISDEESTDGENSLKFHMKHTRPSSSDGAASRGNFILDAVPPQYNLVSLDIYGDNLSADGGEPTAGSGTFVLFLYHTNNSTKSISITTHATQNKDIPPSYVYDGVKYNPTVRLYEQVPQGTWKAVSENVTEMYDNNGLGDYDSDVTSWSLLVGGKGWTSQHGGTVEWKGYVDNVSITTKEISCGDKTVLNMTSYQCMIDPAVTESYDQQITELQAKTDAYGTLITQIADMLTEYLTQ